MAYLVRFRSLSPSGLGDLQGQVRNLPAGVRAQLYQQFSRHATRFELIVLDASFLVEVPSDQSPEDLVRQLDLAIVSGKARWFRVPVRVPAAIELIRKPLFGQ